MGGYCTDPMFLFVDNSDSPSIMEQLQQGHGSGCYTFISSRSWPYDVSYALCLSTSLLQHAYIILCFLFLFYILTFPVFFFSITPTTSKGFCSTFYPGCFLDEPCYSLSNYVYPGIACLAFQASDWAGAF